MSVAERVGAEIGRKVKVPVTVSIGLATMPENALDGDRLLSAADAALYEAKRNGRDRILLSIREGRRRLSDGARPTTRRWPAPSETSFPGHPAQVGLRPVRGRSPRTRAGAPTTERDCA